MSIDSKEKLYGWSVSDPWDIPEFRDWRDKKETSQSNKGVATECEKKNCDCWIHSDAGIQVRTAPLLLSFEGDETDCLLDLMTWSFLVTWTKAVLLVWWKQSMMRET